MNPPYHPVLPGTELKFPCELRSPAGYWDRFTKQPAPDVMKYYDAWRPIVAPDGPMPEGRPDDAGETVIAKSLAEAFEMTRAYHTTRPPEAGTEVPEWVKSASREIARGFSYFGKTVEQLRTEFIEPIIARHAPHRPDGEGKLREVLVDARIQLQNTASVLHEKMYLEESLNCKMVAERITAALTQPPAAQSVAQERERLREILKAIHNAATDKAGDVMTDPTWNLDYSFEFTLTVKQLRGIDDYLFHSK